MVNVFTEKESVSLMVRNHLKKGQMAAEKNPSKLDSGVITFHEKYFKI